jgi:hypothetical protein
VPKDGRRAAASGELMPVPSLGTEDLENLYYNRLDSSIKEICNIIFNKSTLLRCHGR